MPAQHRGKKESGVDSLRAENAVALTQQGHFRRGAGPQRDARAGFAGGSRCRTTVDVCAAGEGCLEDCGGTAKTRRTVGRWRDAGSDKDGGNVCGDSGDPSLRRVLCTVYAGYTGKPV